MGDFTDIEWTDATPMIDRGGEPLSNDPKVQLRCVECERPVIVERGLIDPPYIICTDCEEKINDVFWTALFDKGAIVPMTDENIPKETNLSLGEALPREMARVRDEVMPVYLSIGPVGLFALFMMRVDLDRAAKAMAEGDTIEMLRVYQSLTEYEV